MPVTHRRDFRGVGREDGEGVGSFPLPEAHGRGGPNVSCTPSSEVDTRTEDVSRSSARLLV